MRQEFGKEKAKRTELIKRAADLARMGYSDTAIGRQLGIHRTTAKRYRQIGEKGAIAREARVRVMQDTLSKHFADLRQTCERLRKQLVLIEPDEAVIEDLHVPRQLIAGRVLVLSIEKMRVQVQRLVIQDELLFKSLKQHTKYSTVWALFQKWKNELGTYISSLSLFHRLLAEETRNRTGLEIIESGESQGVTPHFAGTIYKQACSYAFNEREAIGLGWKIGKLGDDLFMLRFDGYEIAFHQGKEILEKCCQIHREMMKHYSERATRSKELRQAVGARSSLEEMEGKMDLELQKFMLKGVFPGHCDLCPD